MCCRAGNEVAGIELFKLLGRIAIDSSGVDEAIDKVAGKVEAAGQKMSSFGDKMSSVGNKLTLGVTAPLVAIGTKAVQTAANFEAAMSEVSAISGATGEDFDKLEQLAKKMGETTKFSASESADALKYMAMAGWKTEDMLGGLEGVLNLAAAAGADLGTTSDIVTDALTAMGYSAGDAGRLADVMAAASSNANTNVELMGETFKYAGTMAGTLGYSMEDVSLAIGLMANSGVKGSMAGTALNAIMSRLAGNTNGATECINNLGVEFYHADGSARALGDVIDELRVATAGLTTEEKTQIAATVAGEEAKKGLLAVLNATAEDYNKLKTAINECSGSAKNMADTMNDNLSGQLTLLKSQLEALAIQFVELILPYLKEGIEWLSKVLTYISNLDEGTKRMILKAAALLAAIGPVLSVLGKVVSIVGTLISVGSKLSSGIGLVVKAGGLLAGGAAKIVGLFGTVASFIGSTLLPAIGSIASAVGGALVSAIGSLVTFIGGTLIPAIASIAGPVLIVVAVIGGLIAAGVALYKNWDHICAFGKSLWNGLCDFFSGVGERIGNFFSGIGEGIGWLKDKMASKVDEIKQDMSRKVSWLKENIPAAVETMKEATVGKVTEMGEKIAQGFQSMKEKGAEKFNDLKEKWTSKFTETKDKMASTVSEMASSVGGKLAEIRDSAVDKISAIAEKGAAGFESLRERGADAVNQLKEHLSARFADMGSTVFAKFEDLGSKILGNFSGVSDMVSNVVNGIKNLLKFDWKLPEIKLPHFGISWDNSGFLGNLADKIGLPGLPKLDVEWYREGGILTEPTAFGINPSSGNLMVGGEAGPEAVAPIKLLQGYVREAVAEQNNGINEVLNAILSLLSEYMPQYARRSLILDTGVLVGELARPMSEELGRLAILRGRTT